MLWKYWRLSELQSYLNDFNPDLLERLEKILPALSDEFDDSDPTEIYKKSNLVKIVEAFAPSASFQNPDFVRRCLNQLPYAELKELAKTLEINTEQSFSELLDAIVKLGWSNQALSQRFLKHFQLPDHFLPAPHTKLPDYEFIEPPSPESPAVITSAYKPLKSYQAQVFFDAQQKLNTNLARFIIQMPTGAGKTRTAMEFVTSFLNTSPVKNIVVIWLAHSEELCEQAFQCFQDVWQHVCRRHLAVCRAWGSYRIPPSLDMPMFLVGSFDKIFNAIKKNESTIDALRNRIGLVVVDEAHRTVAPTYKLVAKSLLNDTTRVVGLTATPGRTIMEETEDLASFYFGDMVGITVSDGGDVVSMLQQRKVLAGVELEPIITQIRYSLTKAQKERLQKDLDFPPAFLEKLGKDDVRNVEIVKRILRECSASKSVLFFGCNIKHSRFIAALLIYLGVKAAHVDGTTDVQRRRQIIRQFRSGDLQVLCNFGVLSTGFDAPNTDVVCIARPTNSVVLYSQMIGRGLRGPEIGGKETCKVIDVRDNIVGYGDAERVYRYFDDYWS